MPHLLHRDGLPAGPVCRLFCFRGGALAGPPPDFLLLRWQLLSACRGDITITQILAAAPQRIISPRVWSADGACRGHV